MAVPIMKPDKITFDRLRTHVREVPPDLVGRGRRLLGAIVALQALDTLRRASRERLVPPTEVGTVLGHAAAEVGRGLLAGLLGTAAMTLASTIEMKVRSREPSSVPAQAAGKVLGVMPLDERRMARFGRVVHWSYGTLWGAYRGVLALAGMRGPLASLVQFGTVWGTELVVLPALGVVPPIFGWGPAVIAADAAEHLIYATATGLAFEFLHPRVVSNN